LASSADRSTEGFRRGICFGGNALNWYENAGILSHVNSLRMAKSLLGILDGDWLMKALLCLIARFVELGTGMEAVVHGSSIAEDNAEDNAEDIAEDVGGKGFPGMPEDGTVFGTDKARDDTSSCCSLRCKDYWGLPGLRLYS